jgi:hypothetical protein
MRKLLMIIGAATLLLIVVIGTGVGILFYKGSSLDAESRAFVDHAVPAITAHWDKEQFRERASPELLRTLKPGQLSALFYQFSRLGPLATYEGAKGQANMAYFTGSGATISASYVANALFENGSATIRILLFKHDGRWLIQGFHVDGKPTGETRRGT